MDPDRNGGPKMDPDRGSGGGDGSAFGGGAGWLVVAFVSPVGVNVPALAARLLGGDVRPAPGGPTLGSLQSVAAQAQANARRREEQAAVTAKQIAELQQLTQASLKELHEILPFMKTWLQSPPGSAPRKPGR